MSNVVETIGKDELIKMVAVAKGSTQKDAKESLDAVLEAIATALGDGKNVSLNGFGGWEIRERDARKGVNPQLLTKLLDEGVSPEEARNQASIEVEATKTVIATVSPKIKGLVK